VRYAQRAAEEHLLDVRLRDPEPLHEHPHPSRSRFAPAGGGRDLREVDDAPIVAAPGQHEHALLAALSVGTQEAIAKPGMPRARPPPEHETGGRE